MKIDLAAQRKILESLTPKELALEYTRIFRVPPLPDTAVMIDHILMKPRPTAAELIAELRELQDIGDEIRTRARGTMEELEANAKEIRAVLGQQDDNRRDR